MAGISGVSYSLDDSLLMFASPMEAVGARFNLMSTTGAPPHPDSCLREVPFFVGHNGNGQQEDVEEEDTDAEDEDDLEDEDFVDEEDDFLDEDDLEDDLDDDDDDDEEIVSAISAPRRPACHRDD